MQIHFQIESARLAHSAADKMIRRSSDAGSFLRKSSALFSSTAFKMVHAGNYSNRPFRGAKRARKSV